MRQLRATLVRLGDLFRKGKRERELAAEMESHLQLHIEDNLRAGMTADEARRQALIKLGGVEQTKESVRDSRGFPFLENLARDLRFGFRSLIRNRGLSFIAIFALTLGIGATTVMFSVIYSVVVDALPYKNFDRSVVFKIQNLANVGGWKGRDFFLRDETRAFREQNHVFEETIGYNGIRLQYDDGRSVRYWPRGETVTVNTFDFLGVAPLLGRTFSQEDGRLNAPPVFVMNYRFWQSEFGGDPKILNTIFILNGKPTTLVGIMPQRFNAFKANFWLPMRDEGNTPSVMGRLKPGVSVQAAGADLDAIAHRYQKANPGGPFPLPEKFAIVPQTLLDSLIGGFKKTLYSLLAAVLLLLLISCSNVANLLLARATAREKEMAMRTSLGASRARLIQQLLAESFLLAAAASIAGCALAYFGLQVVGALIPAGTLPEETVIRMNGPVLLLALGITLLTTILCGLAPALHILRGDLQPRLAGSGKGVGTTFRHGKLRAALVIGEVALSIVLMIGAGLLMRSFLILTRVDLGFDPKNVLFFRLSLPKAYNTDVDVTRQKKNALTRQILDRLRALPGVTAVSESNEEPPLQDEWTDTTIPGKPHTERWQTTLESVSEGYFQMFGLPLIRGRFFSEDDVRAARLVMVVNQAFVRQYFPGEGPLGRRVKMDVFDRTFLDGPRDAYFEIIGIVGDYKTRNFDNPAWEYLPQAFVPYSVQGHSWRTYMARTVSDPTLLLKTVSQEMRAIEPSAWISTSGTLDGSLREFYRGPQFELVTLGSFASIGLLLVLIGISSVMVYTVSLRTHEIGIRMALGAQQTNILTMVISTGLSVIVGGVALGLLVSYAVTRLLASEISGVSVTDPWTFGAVAALVTAVGLAASYLPALRSTRIDPMVALRYE
jgi:putative ABC transport system permease protein